ncbi:protein GOLM2-like isoform X2 [Liolophura sinensis]|uniref:protein GOLM2-like isoform X2 n=1 Tax=Liolophura sinensis TaxID=3198878 RepID=UPI003158AB28
MVMAASATGLGAGRSPPFVVVGLVVSLCILSFYYWRVSSLNSELQFQLYEQRALFSDEATKHSNAEKRTETVMASLKGCEDAIEKDKTLLAEKENNIKSLNEQVQKKSDECDAKQREKSECDTNLKQCQDDTNGVRQELSTLREESQKRDEELKALKEAAAKTMESACNCDAALQEQRKTIETILTRAVGPQAVQALIQNGIGKPEDIQGLVNQVPQAKEKEQFQAQAKPHDNGVDAAQMAQVENRKIEKPKDDTIATANDAGSNGGEAVEVTTDGKKTLRTENPAETDPDADGDVVGKKVIDEARGDKDDTLKFEPDQAQNDGIKDLKENLQRDIQ